MDYSNPTLFRSVHGTRQTGGTTVAVLGFIVVISLIFSSVLIRSMSTYRQVSQVASWQESLLAAESGSDMAMAALRKSLVDTNAFADWSKTAPDGTPLPNGGMTYTCPQLVHGGEGNTQIDAKVTIDAPPELIDASQRQWYRVRSSGTTKLSGPARLTSDKRDHLLRRLSFVRDRKTGQAVSRPQSTRLVELLVKPTSFENAIVSDLPMALNNHKIIIDSYDSRDAAKSTNGLYDPEKRLKNGDVATNSKLIDAGDAEINGDAYTNSGTIENGANITGEQRDDFFMELTAIKAPTTWSTIEFSPSRVQGNVTLTGGSKDSPKRYKLDAMNIAGTEVVTFAPSAPGVESYVEIWLTGDLKATGSGTISVLPNTNVTIYLEGNIDIKGNGTFNANSQPGRLQILGVEPPPGQTRTMNFSGNGVIVAAIYGPDHDVVFGATGSEGTMWGSLTGKSITMGGTTYIHYDEALADTGYITDYKIRSWFEDNN